jgi:hypothetical protein
MNWFRKLFCAWRWEDAVAHGTTPKRAWVAAWHHKPSAFHPHGCAKVSILVKRICQANDIPCRLLDVYEKERPVCHQVCMGDAGGGKLWVADPMRFFVAKDMDDVLQTLSSWYEVEYSLECAYLPEHLQGKLRKVIDEGTEADGGEQDGRENDVCDKG